MTILHRTQFLRVAAVALVCAATHAFAQDTITADPVAASAPALTTKNVDPRLVRNLCEAAVRDHETRTKKFYIKDVQVSPSDSNTIAECVVSAEEMDRLDPTGNNVKVADVTFGVGIELSTGKVTELVSGTPDDERFAKQAALAAVANALIDIKMTSFSSQSITYTTKVAGKSCKVQVVAQSTAGLHQWLVNRLDCRR
jgi:hypothetical protein